MKFKKEMIIFALSIIGILLVLSMVGLISGADNNYELEDELHNLIFELEEAGYSWLVNSSLEYPSVEVYEKDSDELIMVFENISEDKEYKKYLTDFNGTSDVFDLRVVCLNSIEYNSSEVCGVEFDYVVDPANQTDNITLYENVSDIYHDFLWDKRNIWMQLRSCDDASCSGESFSGGDGTSDSFYTDSVNDINVSDNRYFQFKALLWRNITSLGRINESFTPRLKNVTINFFNSSAPVVSEPIISIEGYPTILNCTTIGYTSNSQLNVSFVWYVDNNYYKTENISSTSGVFSSVINSSEIITNRFWNCSVSAYDGATSDIKTTRDMSFVYDGIYSIYDSFVWDSNNMKMQVRSCDDVSCSGESFIGIDNTSESFIIEPYATNLSLTNLANNRYFQFKVFMDRQILGTFLTPKFYGVNITSSVNETPTLEDNEYPLFNHYAHLNGNSTAYTLTTIQIVYINVSSTNGTVIMQINGSNAEGTPVRNISAIFDNGQRYSVTFSSNGDNRYPVGNYSYFWSSYGNGTDNNYNTSLVKWFNILPMATTTAMYINDSQENITIEKGTNISLEGLNDVPNMNAGIFVDGVLFENKTNGASGGYNFSSVGYYNVTGVSFANHNKSYSSETWWVNVIDTSPTPDVEYPLFSLFDDNNWTFAGENVIVNSTIIKTNGTVIVLFNNVNYSATNLAGNIYQATLNITTAGVYNYYWNSWGNGTSSLYNNSRMLSFTVNQTSTTIDNSPQISGLIETPSDPTTYVNDAVYQFNATITDDISISKVRFEFAGTNYTPTNVGNEYYVQINNLGVGSYDYYWWANDSNSNHTISLGSYTISKATGVIHTFINGTRSNKVYTNGSYANLSSQLITGLGNINIYINNTLWNTGASMILNISQFTTGTYSLNSTYLGNQNYTYDDEVWTLTITSTSISKCNSNFSFIKIPTESNKPYIRLCHFVTFK